MPEQPIKRQHPTLSDVALALATRRSDPLSKVSLNLNAKGDVQIEVDVTDPDPKAAAKQAGDLFDVLRAKYPRESDLPNVRVRTTAGDAVKVTSK